MPLSQKDLRRLATSAIHLVPIEIELNNDERRLLESALRAIDRLRSIKAGDDADEPISRVPLVDQLAAADARAAERAEARDEVQRAVAELECAGLTLTVKPGLPGLGLSATPIAVERCAYRPACGAVAAEGV